MSVDQPNSIKRTFETSFRVGVTLLGGSIVLVCGYYTLTDWAALDQAWVLFEKAHAAHNQFDMDFYGISQASYRLNCAVEGASVLFGTRLIVMGLLGK